MRAIRWLTCLCLLALAGTAAAADKVEVKLVKYDALGQAIKALKGKVVVVDIWAYS